EMRLIFSKDIEIVHFSSAIIQQAIEKCYLEKRQKEEEEKKTEQIIFEGYDLLEKSSDNKGVNLLNSIILEAITQNASDIHFIPQNEFLKVKYRIDGFLQERPKITNEFKSQIITRIKVIAKLDIAEKRLPQDGRIKLNIAKREIDFRVSTIPTVYGERIVLRILDKTNVVLGLDKIGFSKKMLSDFKRIISYPEGIILVTGPTGSGKTTTLYSAINELNSNEQNIMTIEDPVEYKLDNISQISVNTKIDLTFAAGLRHILRQDPDIIMIGEIRDNKTAEIAIQSSLTGHLVFSTLHTNDAPSAIARLVDMKIEPYLLSTTIVAVLAQRLVRKICDNCRAEYAASEYEIRKLNLTEKVLFKGKGCDSCFNTGYSGRCGIYELMVVDERVKKQILLSADSSSIKAVLDKNYKTLRSSGIELVKKGVTTFEELIRVTRW
ncbi:MAG: type II/IV secretion system protein, partial [Parachlamydiales bacterium]|nr:type II/IV secretion system protein [Parachlamydiales bacterium]